MNITVNGKNYSLDVSGSTSLLVALREHVGLTGSKYGCGEGVCGACTVLIGGVPVRSCITPVGSAQNKEIITVEGLEQNGKLHRVQEALLEADPFQCAYCASGMVMSAVALLERNPSPSKEEIKDAMQGNICRCCTYPDIVDAIAKVANA
ncbi:MAG: (2Fe-2S)-binding protein [Cyclobacteriaceae bacterium]|nr:MAG: (2Fe-2S)-binding protein [Cyclobacteriaceae bacterium]